jgi:aryl-alcohol dehydrogenase-like predicted oxidoreductase
MHYRNLGASGLRVSAVGLGCNNFGGRTGLDATQQVVGRAIDAGITLFDTADSYGNRGGSEEFLGQSLGERRKDIVLATKFGWPMDDAGHKKGGSRRYILSAVEDSLRRLQTDWIDLFQFHVIDPLTPVEETLRALDDLVRAGKVRHIGWSNAASWQLVDTIWTSRASGLERFISIQAEYSLLDRKIEADLIPAAIATNVSVLPFYPLAGGMLTGKYRADAPLPQGARLTGMPKMADRYMTPSNWSRMSELDAYCAARGHTILDGAIAWLLAQGVVGSVIAGATRPEQVDANVAAAGWQLTAEEANAIGQIFSPL